MKEELERARRDRDYSSLHLWNVKWDEFRQNGFVNRIRDVNAFQFGARLSGLGRWGDLVEPSRVALQLHEVVESSLETAGFMHLPNLLTIIEPERLTFRYTDTDFGFDLTFHGDGRVLLERQGSTLETFHEWYTGLMPTVPVILQRAIGALASELQHALKDVDVGLDSSEGRDTMSDRVRLLNAYFTFEVICCRFHKLGDPSKQRVRNLDVLRRNIAVALPDSRGRFPDRDDDDRSVRPGTVAFENYGRMDYRVSLRHEHRKYINQWLDVSSPSNANWSGLFFSLNYTGEGSTNVSRDGHVKRERLDPTFFLDTEAAADAYISFFRDIGLEGFVQSVTKGYDFETTAAGLA